MFTTIYYVDYCKKVLALCGADLRTMFQRSPGGEYADLEQESRKIY